MRYRRVTRRLLWVEELEPRVVLSVTSTNWSGYAAETSFTSPLPGAVTAVSGSWTVPKVLDTSGTAYSSFWVGIDGYSSNSVEQTGTASEIINGKTRYYAWYEMYPNPVVQITSITVTPGDVITASVTADASNNFTVTISDGAQTPFSKTVLVSGAKRSSAEWIAEAPSGSFGHILPLVNFGTASFSKASATISGTTGAIDDSHWQNTSINMVAKNGGLKAATTPANPFDSTANGVTTSSFSVAWKSSGTGGGKGGNAGTRHHWWHSTAEMFQGAGDPFTAHAPPASNLAYWSATPANNGMNAHFNAPTANPTSPAWMASGVFGADTPAGDDEAVNLDLVLPTVSASVAMPSIKNVASSETVPTRAAVVVEQNVQPPLVGETVAAPSAPISEPETPVASGVKAASNIFWFAGAALFFAHGAFFSKSREIVQEEERERRSGVKV